MKELTDYRATLIKAYSVSCIDETYIVEFWQTGEAFEAWLTKPYYSVKKFIFGAPTKQQSLEDFVKYTTNDLLFDIADFEKNYGN